MCTFVMHALDIPYFCVAFICSYCTSVMHRLKLITHILSQTLLHVFCVLKCMHFKSFLGWMFFNVSILREQTHFQYFKAGNPFGKS